ncbi:MAG: GTP cyclohydrolase [Saprospiraceae bacterium]|nr:GTP cyclohydrolase [Saprospiraceae bacterium]
MIRLIIILLVSSIPLLTKAQDTTKNLDKVIIKPQKKHGDYINDTIYQARIKKTKLDGMYIPKDLNDVFRELNKLMDDEAKKTFMAFSDEEVDLKTHRTMGLWLEHKWSLSEGSRLSEYFRKMRVPHYDYMIGIIITSYHRHLHGKNLKLKEQVLRFRKIWNKKQKEKANNMLQTGKIKNGLD